MLKYAIEKLKKQYPCQLRNLRKQSRLWSARILFQFWQYRIVGLGNLSFQEIRCLGGGVKIHTLILTPWEKDLPVFSWDSISALGSVTMVVELLDTLLDKEVDLSSFADIVDGLSHLENAEGLSTFRDSLRLVHNFAKRTSMFSLAALVTASQRYFDTYLALANTLPPCTNPVAKEKNIRTLVENLLEQDSGTEAYYQVLGIQRTKQLFHNILYGV